MTSVRCASVSRDRPPPKLDCCQLMNHHHVLKQDRFTQPACHPTQPSKLPAIIPQTLPYTPTPPSTLHPAHTLYCCRLRERNVFTMRNGRTVSRLRVSPPQNGSQEKLTRQTWKHRRVPESADWGHELLLHKTTWAAGDKKPPKDPFKQESESWFPPTWNIYSVL